MQRASSTVCPSKDLISELIELDVSLGKKRIVARAEIRRSTRVGAWRFLKLEVLYKYKAAALRDSALRCASVQSWLYVTFIYFCLFIFTSLVFISLPTHATCVHKPFLCSIAREGALRSNSATSSAISR